MLKKHSIFLIVLIVGVCAPIMSMTTPGFNGNSRPRSYSLPTSFTSSDSSLSTIKRDSVNVEQRVKTLREKLDVANGLTNFFLGLTACCGITALCKGSAFIARHASEQKLDFPSNAFLMAASAACASIFVTHAFNYGSTKAKLIRAENARKKTT